MSQKHEELKSIRCLGAEELKYQGSRSLRQALSAHGFARARLPVLGSGVMKVAMGKHNRKIENLLVSNFQL